MQQLPAGGGMARSLRARRPCSRSCRVGCSGRYREHGRPDVVSDALDVTRVLEHFEGRGVRCKALTVSRAYNRLMDPMMEAFRAEISLSFHPATCTVVSNLSGSVAGPEISTVDYWVHHARAAVRFSPAIAAAVGEGITCFVEVGPHRYSRVLRVGHCPRLAWSRSSLRRGSLAKPGSMPVLQRFRPFGAV